VEISDPNLKDLLKRAPTRSFAVAESITSGQLQARVGAISGASHFFRGGITTYTLDAKVRHLGVDRTEAERCDCVSESVARQMARGAAILFEADLAAATTGYAEPYAEQGVDVPFAWWAIAERRSDGSWPEVSGRVECPGLDRVAVQQRVTDEVWRCLVNYLRSGDDIQRLN
jgi:nicotinamide-nucleotide amidase